MKVLGITGGVGAGKSTILDYLNRRYHARIIEADKVAIFLWSPARRSIIISWRPSGAGS